MLRGAGGELESASQFKQQIPVGAVVRACAARRLGAWRAKRAPQCWRAQTEFEALRAAAPGPPSL
jgi:hypothetical protein